MSNLGKRKRAQETKVDIPNEIWKHILEYANEEEKLHDQLIQYEIEIMNNRFFAAVQNGYEWQKNGFHDKQIKWRDVKNNTVNKNLHK